MKLQALMAPDQSRGLVIYQGKLWQLHHERQPGEWDANYPYKWEHADYQPILALPEFAKFTVVSVDVVFSGRLP